MQLFHGIPYDGCYSCSGECWDFDSEEEAKEFYDKLNPNTYSKVELGLHGESGEENDSIVL